ncbi:hypothetical protein [Cohaesibacter celericrescens]|uniref:hypothetical protein n=1 Tax=Cohaesibacter celericrescens TaxID=2067669 RepID=UPI0011AF6E04|nr:hypothetical protein [Cohaesibacter celericrescens]
MSPALAIACHFLLVSGTALFLTPMAPLVVVFSLIFQNMFVSIFSDFLVDQNDYNFVRGYNFLTMMILWLWLFGQYGLNWRSYGRTVNRIMGAGLIGFGLIGVYFLLGMAKNPSGAIIYLRNIISPLVIFQIFFLTSLRSRQPLTPFFVTITILVIILGFIEMLDRELWLDMVNGWRLWEVGNREAVLGLVADKSAKETGLIVRNILDTMRVAFLNTPLLGENSFVILRMSGPNIHAISYSYVLAFLSILMLMNRRWYLTLPIIPLLLLASAKGSMIMMLLAFSALLARKLFGAVFAIGALLFVLAVYIGLGIITGLNIGDFHVLGFMGGVYNFIGYPFGNGLGDGGNLVSNFNNLDWPAYQAAGRTPIAMESAVGVMLHQMGIATFGLLAVYAWIAAQTYKVSLESRINLHSIASFILIIVMVNGIFQEEAIFSPLALGLIMGLNGHILGQASGRDDTSQ